MNENDLGIAIVDGALRLGSKAVSVLRSFPMMEDSIWLIINGTLSSLLCFYLSVREACEKACPQARDSKTKTAPSTLRATSWVRDVLKVDTYQL